MLRLHGSTATARRTDEIGATVLALSVRKRAMSQDLKKLQRNLLIGRAWETDYPNSGDQ